MTTVADGDTIWADNNGEREKARLIGTHTPESPTASVAVSYQHCPACWVQQLEQTGFSFSAAGFGFLGPRTVWALGSRHHRGAAELCGTTHKTVKRIVERAEAGGEPPQREPQPRNFDAVRDLVANGSPSQEARSRPSGCCRSPARPVMSARRGTFGAWWLSRKRCGARIFIVALAPRCGRRVSIW